MVYFVYICVFACFDDFVCKFVIVELHFIVFCITKSQVDARDAHAMQVMQMMQSVE
jgi:hypothetical protein